MSKYHVQKQQRYEQWCYLSTSLMNEQTCVMFQKGDISAMGVAPVEQPGPMIM